MDRYNVIRKRISRFNPGISDKDIILNLDKEINYYRNEIERLKTEIKLKDKNPNRIDAIYKGLIFKYENGDINILYDCEKNNRCKKTNCSKQYCTRTTDEKYARDYKNNINEL